MKRCEDSGSDLDKYQKDVIDAEFPESKISKPDKPALYGVEFQPSQWRLWQTLSQCVAHEGSDVDIYELRPRLLGKFSLELTSKDAKK